MLGSSSVGTYVELLLVCCMKIPYCEATLANLLNASCAKEVDPTNLSLRLDFSERPHWTLSGSRNFELWTNVL